MGSQRSRLHVAVIGAGPGGLAACHHLLQDSDFFSFACYEQCEAVGGAWLYKPKTNEENDSHACMYDNLRTNLPRETMSFPDFPLTAENCGVESLPSFVQHQDVLNYLNSYCDHFNLRPHIKFNRRVTCVEAVSRADPSQPVKFLVTTTTFAGEKSSNSEIFDAVMICTGHYSKPKWPSTDFSLYKGRVMYSKFYRRAAQFAGFRKVVVMGGGPSGIDIAFDLEANSEDVQLLLACHTNRTGNDFHETIDGSRVKLKPDIVRAVGPTTIEFSDGSTEADVDAVIMCTGYHFDFPFLDEKLALDNDRQRLTPLYQHLLHMDYPNLCFIGLPTTSLPIPMGDLQVRYFLALLKHQFELPSREKMLEVVEQGYRLRTQELGWPHRYAHKMGPLLEKYFASLSNESGVEPIEKKVFDFYNFTGSLRAADPVGYKCRELVLNDKGDVTCAVSS